MEQHNTFTTQDGTELFYRYRPAKNDNSGKAIVLFHRGHEHSGRMICFWPTNWVWTTLPFSPRTHAATAKAPASAATARASAHR